MSSLSIATDDNRTEFFPGEKVTGHVAWKFDERPESVELRLFWYTRGKGDVDVEVIDTVPFENPTVLDERKFSVRLPEAPYSFSGKIVSLIWALELVAQPSGDTERLDILVTPTGAEIMLHKSADTKA